MSDKQQNEEWIFDEKFGNMDGILRYVPKHIPVKSFRRAQHIPKSLIEQERRKAVEDYKKTLINNLVEQLSSPSETDVSGELK